MWFPTLIENESLTQIHRALHNKRVVLQPRYVLPRDRFQKGCCTVMFSRLRQYRHRLFSIERSLRVTRIVVMMVMRRWWRSRHFPFTLRPRKKISSYSSSTQQQLTLLTTKYLHACAQQRFYFPAEFEEAVVGILLKTLIMCVGGIRRLWLTSLPRYASSTDFSWK